MVKDKRQDRALKICLVGKFSEGDSMQGWKKTKVKGSKFKAQSSMSPEIMNCLFLNLSLNLSLYFEVEVEIKIKDKSRSEAKTQSEAWG